MTTDMRYPRAWVALSMQVGGEQIDTGIVPSRASFTRRSHNQAGTAEVEVHGSAMPYDPDVVDGCYATLFVAEPGSDVEIDEIRVPRYKRFVGYADTIKDKHDGNGPAITLALRDLSALYRDHKPLVADAHPRYADTAAAAIQRVIAAVPATSRARVRLREVAGMTDRPLSAAQHGGRPVARSNGRLPLPRDATAWIALEHIASAINALIGMEYEEIVLRDPAQSFAADAPIDAEFIFGADNANLLSVEREKKYARNRKGLFTTSYDPHTRRTLRVVYPPDAQLLALHRPAAATGATAAARTGRARPAGGRAAPPERDPVAAPNGVTSEAALLAYLQRVYEERSRQEIEGKIECPDFTNSTLALRNGSRFTLRLHAELAAELRGVGTDDAAAVDLLCARMGVARDAARVLVRVWRQRRDAPFYVRSITSEFDAHADSKHSLEFINLIRV